jgi:hypothetical protein
MSPMLTRACASRSSSNSIGAESVFNRVGAIEP